MIKDNVKKTPIMANMIFPSIGSPKRRNDSHIDKIPYKKFFAPSIFEEIKIPPFEYKMYEKLNSNYQEKINYYRKLNKFTNGRINCVSVIPNRDSEYISKTRLKKKLKISVDLPKLKIFCKTPSNDLDLIIPTVSMLSESPHTLEKTRIDAMISTND